MLRDVVASGAGEVFLNNVDRDGTMGGYDLELIRSVTQDVNVPVIACGGAGTVGILLKALEGEASAVAAGSMFYFTEGTEQYLFRYLKPTDLLGLHLVDRWHTDGGDASLRARVEGLRIYSSSVPCLCLRHDAASGAPLLRSISVSQEFIAPSCASTIRSDLRLHYPWLSGWPALT